MKRKTSNKVQNKSFKKQHKSKKTCFMTSAIKVLCAAVISTILFGGFYTSAQNNRTEEPVNFKYYKSITIESGDSLWSLAEEYMTDDYESAEEFVQVLKEINGLYDDTIIAGQKIIVAYNDTAFIE